MKTTMQTLWTGPRKLNQNSGIFDELAMIWIPKAARGLDDCQDVGSSALSGTFWNSRKICIQIAYIQRVKELLPLFYHRVRWCLGVAIWNLDSGLDFDQNTIETVGGLFCNELSTMHCLEVNENFGNTLLYCHHVQNVCNSRMSVRASI